MLGLFDAVGEDPDLREENEDTRIGAKFKPRQTEEAGYVIENQVFAGEKVYATRKCNGWGGTVRFERGMAVVETRKSGIRVCAFDPKPYFHEMAERLNAVFICEIVATRGGQELGYAGVSITTALVDGLASSNADENVPGLQLRIICFYKIDDVLFTRFTHRVMRGILNFLVRKGSPDVEVIPELSFTLRVLDGAKTFIDEGGASFAEAEGLLRHLERLSDESKSEGWVLTTEHDARHPGKPFEMDTFGTPRYRFSVKWKRAIRACVVCARCNLIKGDGYEQPFVLFAAHGSEFFKCGVVQRERCAPYIKWLLDKLELFNPSLYTTTTLEALTRMERTPEELLAKGCALDVSAAWATMVSIPGGFRAGALLGLKYVDSAHSPPKRYKLTDLTRCCAQYPHWGAVHAAYVEARRVVGQQPRRAKQQPPAPAPLGRPSGPPQPEVKVYKVYVPQGKDTEHRQGCRDLIAKMKGWVVIQMDATTDFIVVPPGGYVGKYQGFIEDSAPNAKLIYRADIREALAQPDLSSGKGSAEA